MEINRKVYTSGHSQVIAIPPYMLEYIGLDPVHRRVKVWTAAGAIIIKAHHLPRRVRCLPRRKL